MVTFHVGARTQSWLTLDADAIRAGATLVGDFNPLHHDEAFAARTRFGGLFASGAHTSALLAGAVSQGWPSAEPDSARGHVGVDYAVQFKAPCPANHRLRLEWEVTAIEPKSRGHIVRLDGQIVDEDTGVVVLTGRMAMLSYGD
ncbi:hypothetical protein GCM10019059_25910 [Camelimonas fluminis]|uniref:MaoC family dehydratase n=1 Tax=Camelimonas fluminis TaxID=1576911 RepID=A0ABV7UND0_9HYPH|nr:MaoC family dehydratase [Camelimonas fluminis]GHE65041.1 hypothetical protein GCM10019059_25910 [Camelimonas fluminis]